jgi:hypothetical protein
VEFDWGQALKRVSVVSLKGEQMKSTYEFLGNLCVLDFGGLVERHAADEFCQVARGGAAAS